MATLQTLLALAVLIYVLCVIVQAVQEVFKSLLDSKASTMEKVIHDFMDDHLRLDQVKSALEARGLDIATLEHLARTTFDSCSTGSSWLFRRSRASWRQLTLRRIR
jgi:hypothetical protein